MISPDFWSVFTFTALIYAITSGVLLGATLLAYIALRRPPATYLSFRKQAALAVIVLTVLGTVFFAGQVTQAIIEKQGIAAEPVRIFARYCLWVVFAVSVGVSNSWVLSFAKRKKG